MRLVLCTLFLLIVPAVANAQCTKDTDCKGERVCVDGKCQDPSAPPPAAAPKKNEEEPPPPPPPDAEKARRLPLVGIAEKLAQKIGMPNERQERVLRRLGLALVKEHIAKDKKVCVFAYQMGEGGFIVKQTRGKGVIECAGDARNFTIKSTTFGAMIGGSSEWGVGLVFGITSSSSFGGDYKGSTRGATAGDASTNVTELKLAGTVAPERYHELFMIGAAAGLSANAGGARLTLQLD